jgi:hypothetical protein
MRTDLSCTAVMGVLNTNQKNIFSLVPNVEDTAIFIATRRHICHLAPSKNISNNLAIISTVQRALSGFV